MKILDLFAGIGGFSYAAHFLEIGETKHFVEINPFCQKVLTKNFPNIPIHDDITTFNPLRGQYDIITFGSPCQDLSQAGKQKGIHGDRSGLFFHAVRVVKQVQPKGFIMENVTGIRRWQEEVLVELQEIGGYNLYWFSVSAKELGGCHKRERWFCIGWRDSTNPRHSSRGDATEQYPEGRGEILSTVTNNGNKVWSKTTGCDRMGGYANDTNSESKRPQEISQHSTMRTSSESARVYITDPDSSGTSRDATIEPQGRATTEISPCSQSTEEEAITRICGGDDGISNRLDLLINQLMSPVIAHKHIREGTASDNRELKDRAKRIQALGNAVTPQQAGICLYILTHLLGI